MKSKIQHIISILILSGFIYLVERYFDWEKILSPWEKLQTTDLIITSLLILTTYWIRSLRIYDYFKNDMQNEYKTCLKLSLHHNMLNNLLPMRTGEITFPVLMSRYFNINASRSVPVLLWFRLLDLHTLLAIAIMVMGVILFNTFIAIAGLIVWLTIPFILFRSNTVLLSKFGHNAQSKLSRLIVKGLHSLPQSNDKFYRSWGWTWLNWLLKLGVSSWIILLFLNTSISIAYMGAIMGDLTSVLPIYGIAGFGTYEAGILAGLLPFENMAENTTAINSAIETNITADYKENALQAAIYLHLIILGSAITGGLIAALLPGNKAPKNKLPGNKVPGNKVSSE